MTPPNRTPPPAAHSLFRYFALTVMNSICMTIIVATMFFWTRSVFHYTDRENLWLSMAVGLAIVPGARYGGRLADRIGPDRLLAWAFAIDALLLLTGWLPAWRYTPFAVALLYACVVSTCWPALESAIFHAPSRFSKPQRLSIYNVTWSSANTLGLLTSSLLVAWNPASVIWVPGILHAVSLLFLIRTGSRPAPVPAAGVILASAAAATGGIQPSIKRRFMHTAWLGNALTYVMISVLLPLLPALAEKVGRSPSTVIVMTCIFYLTRSLAFVLFGRWEAWHYHRGWNFAALLTAPLAFAGIMLTPSLGLILASMALFGLALGLTYSSSIFYSLDYGEGKGEHGGLHEAVIGMGNLAGPLVGVLGSVWWNSPNGAPAATLALVILGTLIASWLLPSCPRSGIR